MKTEISVAASYEVSARPVPSSGDKDRAVLQEPNPWGPSAQVFHLSWVFTHPHHLELFSFLRLFTIKP